MQEIIDKYDLAAPRVVEAQGNLFGPTGGAINSRSNNQPLTRIHFGSEYANEKDRDFSFENRNWPQNLQHVRQLLTGNGFFCNEDGSVECFTCGIKWPFKCLKSLKGDEDIWKGHARENGECAFLRLLKGDLVVDKECDAAKNEKVIKIKHQIQAGKLRVDWLFDQALDDKTEIELLTEYIKCMDGMSKKRENEIKRQDLEMKSLYDYCRDSEEKMDKLKEEMKKLEEESHQKIMEAQQQKKTEVKEQKIITIELNKYARYLERKTESLKRKICRNDLQIEGLQKENDRLYKNLELNAYFFNKEIKIMKRKIAFLNDIYLREVDQKNQLKTEKENLVRIIRGQDCQRKEVERLKKEIKCLEQQLKPRTVAVSACMEMGYSHEKVMRASQILHERQGCVSAESLMRILMEMEEEEEPLGGVGGGQG